ncbi:MAG: type II toxin-antitoxin system VapC family toxin, partial [Lachnospiraceae bacterium]|nr:type II toxin-antitoxin system VapC family toxin [Lachnospiraceae bacterium]
YMLDTNIIAYAKNGSPPSVLEKLLACDPSEICISSITLAELEYGICNSSNPDQNRIATMMFLAEMTFLPFDSDAAIAYGDIRFDLKSRALLIGANDLLIAAHARSQNLTLVTHNTREFSRVKGLKLVDWV